MKDGHRYNGNFAYAYNALTLLHWKFTGGLYYELVGISEFGNEMPYSVFAIEELDVALQIDGNNGIGAFIEGKAGD